MFSMYTDELSPEKVHPYRFAESDASLREPVKNYLVDFFARGVGVPPNSAKGFEAE